MTLFRLALFLEFFLIILLSGCGGIGGAALTLLPLDSAFTSSSDPGPRIP